jgi:hypothetical protein
MKEAGEGKVSEASVGKAAFLGPGPMVKGKTGCSGAAMRTAWRAGRPGPALRTVVWSMIRPFETPKGRFWLKWDPLSSRTLPVRGVQENRGIMPLSDCVI